MALGIFDRLASKIKSKWKNLILRLKKYLKRLLFPLYLFPLKLLTYSAFYAVRFVFKLVFAILGLIWDCVSYPFRSLKNFLKALVFSVIGLYLLASLFVIIDYLLKQYGYLNKFLCSFGTGRELQQKVVRIVGGYGEGSGFFVAPDQVLTNFHVIADEPSPKIIFPDGNFTTPVKILGDKDADLAVLFTGNWSAA